MAPLRDPVPKFLHFFWKGFRTRLFKTKICKIPQEWLFLQRKKSALKRSYRVRGMGPPPGTRFCMHSYHTKQNKKAKTKKHKFCLGFLYQINILCFHSVRKNHERDPERPAPTRQPHPCFVKKRVFLKKKYFFHLCLASGRPLPTLERP